MLYEHAMIDLETLGKEAGCSILSIGVVAFGLAGVGPELHVIVSRDSCARHGLAEDQDTLAWWMQQTREAQETLDHATEGGLPLSEALAQLNNFLGLISGHNLKDVKVWGNGADFDLPILSAAYKKVGDVAPWRFFNSRCYRTLKNLLPNVPMPERQGTHHNAVDDARTQALHAVKLLRALDHAVLPV
jgi:hypothetical protein